MPQDLEIRKRCVALLEKNSVKYGDVVYTRPSSGYYNFLWLWDSCFHTLIWSYFDINRALQELEAIFCGQAPGGMLPHMICFDKKKKLHRSPTVGEFKLWNDRGTSNLTQPPVLGFVLWRIYENTKNVKFIERFFDRTVEYYRALKKERDPDRDGLISIIHPWESGWDDSPRWDPVYGIKNPSKEDLAGRKLDLMNEYWATNWNVAKASFNVESADFNSIYLSSLRSLAKIANVLNRKEEEEELLKDAEKTANAIQKLWHKDGYYDIFGREEKRIEKKTPAIFFPMFAGVANKDQADTLINVYRNEFFTKYPLPTIVPSDPTFDPDRYWRGTTWINVNWFVIQSFENYGFHNEAKNIFRKSYELIEKSGFREYYNPLTGKGLGAKDFCWDTLILDLIKRKRS